MSTESRPCLVRCSVHPIRQPRRAEDKETEARPARRVERLTKRWKTDASGDAGAVFEFVRITIEKFTQNPKKGEFTTHHHVIHSLLSTTATDFTHFYQKAKYEILYHWYFVYLRFGTGT